MFRSFNRVSRLGLAALGLALVGSLSASAHADRLSAATGGSVNYAGVYFDLTTGNSSVTINSISAPMTVSMFAGSVAVWAKPGTYAGSEGNSFAWSEISQQTVTNMMGLSPIKLSTTRLTIPANTTEGIFLFSVNPIIMPGMNVNFMTTSGRGIATYGNADLGLRAGEASALPFQGGSALAANQMWNGSIDYTVNQTAAVPEPAAITGIGLATLGLLRRRRRAAAC